MVNQGFEMREIREAEEEKEDIKVGGQYHLAKSIILLVAALFVLFFTNGILRQFLVAVLIIAFISTRIRQNLV